LIKELREEGVETDRRMQETDRLIKELRDEGKETARQMKETDRQMKETDRLIQENALQQKETERLISRLGNRFGELIEHLVAPNIMGKFNELGFDFTRCSTNFMLKEPGSPQALAEVDIMLENGGIVIAVEVKAKPERSDVEDHIERMETLRKDADQRGDKRRYRGAVAGAILNDHLRRYILQKGFYLIEQTGDTVRINMPEGFSPREW
jgi:hypothetical protein